MRETRRGPRFVLCVAALALLAAPALPAAAGAARPLQGKLDRSFGENGQMALPLGPTFANSHYEEMVRQPDGGIVLAGETEVQKGIYNERSGFVQRRGPSGALDTSFGGGMVQLPSANGLALQEDGRVLVGVEESSGTCGTASTVRRLAADGSPDPGFGQGGTSATLPLGINELAVDSQGRIVVAGYTAVSGPCSHFSLPAYEWALARLLPDGALDPGFGEDGVVRIPGGSKASAGLVVRSDDSIVVAGEGRLAAYTAAGSPELSFGGDGSVETAGVSGALLGLPEDKVALARSSAEACCDRPGHFVVSRYLTDGSLDPGFGSGGSVALTGRKVDVPTALAVGPEGSILLGGEAADSEDCPNIGCDAVPFLARFTASGALDSSFGQAALDLPSRARYTVFSRYVAALAVSPQGQILAAGGSGEGGEATVSALRLDGAPDAGFGAAGRVADTRLLPSVSDAQDLAIGRGGAMLVSAWTDTGSHRSRSVLLGGAEPPVEAEIDGELQSDGRGGFYSYLGSYRGRGRGYVTRFDARGQRDLNYGVEGKAAIPAHFKIDSLVVRRSGQALLVGRVGDRFGMAAFLLTPHGRPERRFGDDGLALVGFGPKVKAEALSASFDRRGRVVLFGNYSRYAGMARLLPNGRPDRDFAYRGRQPYMPGLANEESAVVIAPNGGIVVAAAPERDLGPPPTSLIRFRPDGIRDRSFGHNGVVRVHAGAPMVGFFGGRRLILVSGFGGFGEHGFAIRAFRSDGSPDRRFGHRGVVTALTGKGRFFRPAAAARQPDGRIVVAGTRGKIEEAGSTVELLRFR
jgi:uncharacterized delta-60 repeat protein